MTLSYVDFQTESVQQLIEQWPTRIFEHSYDQGWTDGLPVIPPTPDRVQEFIAASARAGDELVGVIPPRKGRATIEVIAANAVMAGCRPEYMPLIIATIEGLLDPKFPLEHMQVTTHPMTPFLLVNGPVRHSLEINFGAACLGPGWRANATIGRAVRLILVNAGGAVPGVYSKCSLGSPLRYSYICGENEEANPWTPYHVDLGYAPEESTVTIFRAMNFCNISSVGGNGTDEVLRQIATHMLPMVALGDGALLLLGVNHAQSFHAAGLSKRDIQQRLWEYARLPVSYFAKDYAAEEQAAGRGDAKMIWRTRTPEEFYIAVAGGPGPQDVYMAAGFPVTRLIP